MRLNLTIQCYSFIFIQLALSLFRIYDLQLFHEMFQWINSFDCYIDIKIDKKNL